MAADDLAVITNSQSHDPNQFHQLKELQSPSVRTSSTFPASKTPVVMLASISKNQRGKPHQLRRHRYHPRTDTLEENGLFLGYHGVTRDRCGHYELCEAPTSSEAMASILSDSPSSGQADPKARDKGDLVVMKG